MTLRGLKFDECVIGGWLLALVPPWNLRSQPMAFYPVECPKDRVAILPGSIGVESRQGAVSIPQGR